MPNLQASIKDLKQSKKRTVFNNRIRRRLRDAEKAYAKAVEADDKKEAEKQLVRVNSLLDKAAKKGIIKPGNADRNKSRASQKYNQLTAKKDVKAPKSES